jgi:protoporphyrin/coproporphyrin ferrochelatase
MSDVMGVLLMAYGSPDRLEDVEAYYTHIRGGRRPAPELVEELKERYKTVGGRTPLSEISEATRSGLEAQLNSSRDDRYRVFLGMKHWHPYIEQAVGEMWDEGIDRAVGLVLAPHYSRMSIAGYFHCVNDAQEKLGSHIEILPVESWHLHPSYLEAVAARARSRLADFPAGSDVTVVFTAHSLPEKILEQADPYPRQLQETFQAIAQMLRLERWTFSYQSAGRTPDPWLGPDIVDTVRDLADQGVQHILVAPVGFVSEHLEIHYDIDFEAQRAASDRGVTLKRIEMLNSSPDFVAGLADLVRQRAAEARALPAS